MSNQEILKWRKSSIITNANLSTGLQCFIYMGGSLRLAFCLFKTLFFVNLSKFGCRFLCAQKRLPTSKTPCITLCLPPENIRKGFTIFWCFHGVEKGCIGNEWVKASNGNTRILCKICLKSINTPERPHFWLILKRFQKILVFPLLTLNK